MSLILSTVHLRDHSYGIVISNTTKSQGNTFTNANTMARCLLLSVFSSGVVLA